MTDEHQHPATRSNVELGTQAHSAPRGASGNPHGAAARPHGLVGLLVGSQFAPPAQALLRALNDGTRVRVAHDAANPHDPLALRVLWEPCEADLIADDDVAGELEDALAGYGRTREELLAEPSPIMLGHIGRDGNKAVIAGGFAGNTAWHNAGFDNAEGTLRFDGNGQATVESAPNGRF